MIFQPIQNQYVIYTRLDPAIDPTSDWTNYEETLDPLLLKFIGEPAKFIVRPLKASEQFEINSLWVSNKNESEVFTTNWKVSSYIVKHCLLGTQNLFAGDQPFVLTHKDNLLTDECFEQIDCRVTLELARYIGNISHLPFLPSGLLVTKQ